MRVTLSNVDTPTTATAMRTSTEPPARTDKSRFFKLGLTAARARAVDASAAWTARVQGLIMTTDPTRSTGALAQRTQRRDHAICGAGQASHRALRPGRVRTCVSGAGLRQGGRECEGRGGQLHCLLLLLLSAGGEAANCTAGRCQRPAWCGVSSPVECGRPRSHFSGAQQSLG